MHLRTRIGTFVAAVCVAAAIGAAPANAAAPSIPSTASIAALCKNIKDPKTQAACVTAAGKINTLKPADIKALIEKYGKSFTGLNIGSLSGLLAGLGGGSSIGGIDISKLIARTRQVSKKKTANEAGAMCSGFFALKVDAAGVPATARPSTAGISMESLVRRLM